MEFAYCSASRVHERSDCRGQSHAKSSNRSNLDGIAAAGKGTLNCYRTKFECHSALYIELGPAGVEGGTFSVWISVKYLVEDSEAVPAAEGLPDRICAGIKLSASLHWWEAAVALLGRVTCKRQRQVNSILNFRSSAKNPHWEGLKATTNTE